MSTNPRLGRQLIFDQVLVDLPVKYPGGIGRPVATLILDRETLLVLGADFARQDEVGVGFRGAINDLSLKRMPEIVEETAIPFAKHVK
jgi:hypothetical protein